MRRTGRAMPAGMELRVECRVGKDYQEILRFAQERQIDLIVMGRHGHSHGPMHKALFGNVTEKIAPRADCAVLIIPLSYEERITD